MQSRSVLAAVLSIPCITIYLIHDLSLLFFICISFEFSLWRWGLMVCGFQGGSQTAVKC